MIFCCEYIQLHATVVSPDLNALPVVIAHSGAKEFLYELRGRQEYSIITSAESLYKPSHYITYRL